MAVSNFTSYPQNTSAADFRQWGLALYNAIVAAGLAATSDTGQINFTSVAAPGAGSTFMGYTIHAFTDSVGNPISIKLEYGSGATAPVPALRLTVGNGSNGSGTITGNTYTVTIIATTNSTTVSYGFASSNGGYLTFAMFCNIYPIIVSIGRTKSDAGVDTSDGVNIITQTMISSGVRTQTFLPANGGGVATTLASNALHNSAPPTGVGSQGNRLGVYPVFVSRGAADNFDLGVIAVFQNDFNNQVGNGTTVDLPFYGTTRRYIYVWSGGALSNFTINGNNGNLGYSSLLVRYE